MWATDAGTTFAAKPSNKTWANVKSSLPCSNGGLTWASTGTPGGFEDDRGLQFSSGTSSDLTTTISERVLQFNQLLLLPLQMDPLLH